MESWSYDSGNKGFVLSNEAVSAHDFPNVKTKKSLMGWELKDSFYSYDDHIMFTFSQQQPFDNQGVLEVVFPDLKRNQSSPNHVRNASSSIMNTNPSISNVISCNESSSRISNSVVETNSRESSLIDLNLGKFGDNLKYSEAARTSPILSSAESSIPAKRIRALSLNSQPVFCQVYGCTKDLSSSKDYHKRHKVCEVHSKTAKVIINGLEQRFCQQCSRFHLLAEFDGAKRSCRKRLAGHNARRRKPQVAFHSGRAGRLLHPYNGSGGTRSMGATSRTSFICQDGLPFNGAPHSEKYGTLDWHKHVKLEDRRYVVSKPASYFTNWQILQKVSLPPYQLIGKQHPSSENANATSSNVFSESNTNQYPSQDSVPLSLLQNSSLGSEDLTLFDTVSEPGCALSLLSSQPENTSGHPLIIPDNEVSENLFRVTSNNEGFSKQSFCTTAFGTDFADGFLHGSRYVYMKDHPLFDGGPTNLLQLSTQQRQALPVKREN